MESRWRRTVNIESLAGVFANAFLGDLLAEHVAEELAQASHPGNRVGAVSLESVIVEQEVTHFVERDPFGTFDKSSAQRLLNATTKESQRFPFIGCP